MLAVQNILLPEVQGQKKAVNIFTVNIFKVLIQENTVPGSVKEMIVCNTWCWDPVEEMIVCQRFGLVVLQSSFPKDL